ncbi:uncharacterized protein LOC144136280 [Amblyomma americanum]
MPKAKKTPSAVKGTPSYYFTPPTHLASPARGASALVQREQPGLQAHRELQEPHGRPARSQKPFSAPPTPPEVQQQRRHDKQQDGRPRHKQPPPPAPAAADRARAPKLPPAQQCRAFCLKSELSEPGRNAWFACGVVYMIVMVSIIVFLIVYLMLTARKQHPSLTLPAVKLVETENPVKVEPRAVQGVPNRVRPARFRASQDAGSEASAADILEENGTGDGIENTSDDESL